MARSSSRRRLDFGKFIPIYISMIALVSAHNIGVYSLKSSGRISSQGQHKDGSKKTLEKEIAKSEDTVKSIVEEEISPVEVIAPKPKTERKRNTARHSNIRSSGIAAQVTPHGKNIDNADLATRDCQFVQFGQRDSFPNSPYVVKTCDCRGRGVYKHCPPYTDGAILEKDLYLSKRDYYDERGHYHSGYTVDLYDPVTGQHSFASATMFTKGAVFTGSRQFQ